MLQDNKEPKIAAGTTAQYLRGDKTWQTLNAAAVGLSNVPNVNAVPVTGGYTGNDVANRTFALGFKPRAVLISGPGSNDIYVMRTEPGWYNPSTVEITETGFVIVSASIANSSSKYYYNYVAWR